MLETWSLLMFPLPLRLGANTATFISFSDRLFNLSMMIHERACHVHCSEVFGTKEKLLFRCYTRHTHTLLLSSSIREFFPLKTRVNKFFCFLLCYFFPHLKWILDEHKGKFHFHFRKIFQFGGFTNTGVWKFVCWWWCGNVNTTESKTPIEQGGKSYRLKFVCCFISKTKNRKSL